MFPLSVIQGNYVIMGQNRRKGLHVKLATKDTKSLSLAWPLMSSLE